MMNNDFKVTQRSGDGRQHVSDVRVDEKLTEVVVGGIVHTANDGYYYRRVVQDNGRTVKFFVEKKHGNV